MKKYICLFISVIILCSLLAGCKNETVPEDAYYLVIGAEGVKEILIETPKSSGGVENADGSLFRMGDKVMLEHLDGIDSLRGVTVTAVNEAGETVYMFHIPMQADDGDITKLVLGDTWLVAPTGN